MAHIPINHPLRGFWRGLAGLIGAYVLVFGIVGLARTWGEEFFSQDDVWALGLRTNLAFSLLSIVVGAVLFGGAVRGRNADHFINLAGGVVFCFAGMVMLATMETGMNLLNYSVASSVVSFLIGMLLLTAGLYGKVGTDEESEAEHHFRVRGRNWHRGQGPGISGISGAG